MSFLTFGLNFSLLLHNCTNFSLFTLNFSLLATNLANFSLLAWISHFWPLFQWNFHFSSKFLTFPAAPTPTPAGPLPRQPTLSVSPVRPPHTPAGPSRAGPPNDMVTTMLLACSEGHACAGRHVLMGRHAPADQRLTCQRAKSEKFTVKSEKFLQSCTISEKFDPKSEK